MRRFYCTVCKKIKRVQKWPVILSNRDSELPEQRVGECNRHSKSNQILAHARRTNQPVTSYMKAGR